MKCTCKALVAFAGGIAMVSSASVASPDMHPGASSNAKSNSATNLSASDFAAPKKVSGPVVMQSRGNCDPECADVTGELDVNLADLNLVLANFGQATSVGDANCDGQVNLADLNLVLAQFGTTCEGSGVNDTPETAAAVECGSSFSADLTQAAEGVDVAFACRPTGATNDLWYSFVATGNAVSVTTCGSLAPADDSVVAVYDSALNSLGCNDDGDCGDLPFLSELTVTGLTVGETYFIQVGAWAAGDIGEYTVNVNCFDAGECVTCGDATVIETEPTLVDGDTDTFNGGCNTDGVNPPTEADLSIGDIVCGTASLYATDTDGDGVPNNLRDTDWYQFTLNEQTVVEWKMTATGPGQVILASWNNLDCAGVGAPFIQGAFTADNGEGCQVGSVVADLAPGTYLAFAAYQGGSGNPNGSTLDYRAELSVFVPPVGACCDFDGNCTDGVLEADCNGFWTEDGACADIVCAEPLACPDGSIWEAFGDGTSGEFLFDNYVDATNGGCNSSGPGQLPVVIDFLNCGDSYCGTSGNYLNGGTQTRDTDWYDLTLFADTDVTVTYEASFDALVGIIPMNADGSCPDAAAFLVFTTGETGEVSATLSAGSYIVFVSTAAFTGTPANAPYNFTITCAEPAPVGCCFADGSCTDLLPSDCATQGGSSQADVCANVTCPIVAANDTVEGAIMVACGDTFIADLTTASAGIDGPFSCGNGGGNTNDLWYSFVATSETATVTTCGNGNATPADDTVIDVYDSNLVEVGCGEDNCDAAGGGPYLSTVDLVGLTVGETYFIRIAAWAAGDVAAYNVTVTCP